MPSNPQGPQPFPCGGEGQQPCPPQPAIRTDETGMVEYPPYTHRDMLAHGHASYEKGRKDARKAEPSDKDVADWRKQQGR
jgi:hypothetical protein